MQHSVVKWCYQKTDGYWLTQFAIKAEMVDIGRHWKMRFIPVCT